MQEALAAARVPGRLLARERVFSARDRAETVLGAFTTPGPRDFSSAARAAFVQVNCNRAVGVWDEFIAGQESDRAVFDRHAPDAVGQAVDQKRPFARPPLLMTGTGDWFERMAH